MRSLVFTEMPLPPHSAQTWSTFPKDEMEQEPLEFDLNRTPQLFAEVAARIAYEEPRHRRTLLTELAKVDLENQ